MSGPLGADTSAMIQAIIENAKRLGLTWTRRLATVSDGDNPSAVMATFDGDTAIIAMTSMIGGLTNGQRVYVDIIPPSGNFIAGRAGGYAARQLLTVAATSVTFSNIPAALRSLKLTYQARSDAAVNTQSIQMRIDADSSAIYYSEYVMGTNVTPTAVATSAGTSGNVGIITGSLAPTGRFASGEVTLIGWDNLTPTALDWIFLSQALGPAVASFLTRTGGGVYESAGPYSSVTLLPASGNFEIGSDFQLVGEPS